MSKKKKKNAELLFNDDRTGGVTRPETKLIPPRKICYISAKTKLTNREYP